MQRGVYKKCNKLLSTLEATYGNDLSLLNSSFQKDFKKFYSMTMKGSSGQGLDLLETLNPGVDFTIDFISAINKNKSKSSIGFSTPQSSRRSTTSMLDSFLLKSLNVSDILVWGWLESTWGWLEENVPKLLKGTGKLIAQFTLPLMAIVSLALATLVVKHGAQYQGAWYIAGIITGAILLKLQDLKPFINPDDDDDGG